ncbi:MAG: radical SAM protein [Candidatus Saccharibacteria bacterium]
MPVDKVEKPKIIYTPDTIDIEVTGKCEFYCKDCWGSKQYDFAEELTARQWGAIFNNLENISSDHVNKVVISGGEPLIRKDLENIIDNISDSSNKYITLSTTGLDNNNTLPQIINKINAIGLPIDGPSQSINSIWRKHDYIKDGGLSDSLKTLRAIQENRPELKTTIRTLIHNDNISFIQDIPSFLENQGIDTSRLRWILYELTKRETRDGTVRLVSSKAIESYYLGASQFENDIVESGQSFNKVIIKKIGNMANKKFIINPSGECRAVTSSDRENENIELNVGNINTNFNGTINNFNYNQELACNFSNKAYSDIKSK